MFSVSVLCLHCAWYYNQAEETFSSVWILRTPNFFSQRKWYIWSKTLAFILPGGKVIHQMQFVSSFTFFPLSSALSCNTFPPFPPMKDYWWFGCTNQELRIAHYTSPPICQFLECLEWSGWREMVGVTCLEFQKDFSKVLHRRLLWELSSPEVKGEGLPCTRN